MRVLLAGASSALGRRLASKLRDADHDVTGLVSASDSLGWDGVETLAIDPLDRAALVDTLGLRQFDVIVDLISAQPLPLLTRQLRHTNRLRSEGTSALIALARRTGVTRFVTASSVRGYGLIDHGEVLTEESTFGDFYGDWFDAVQRALLSNEQQVRAFSGICLRLGISYEEPALPIFANDWDGLLPFVATADAADAVVLALTHGEPGSVYNIVDDLPASWHEVRLAVSIARGSRTPVGVPSWLLLLVAPYAFRLLAATSIEAANDLAKKELGWSPAHPMYRDGLRDLIEVVDVGPA